MAKAAGKPRWDADYQNLFEKAPALKPLALGGRIALVVLSVCLILGLTVRAMGQQQVNDAEIASSKPLKQLAKPSSDSAAVPVLSALVSGRRVIFNNHYSLTVAAKAHLEEQKNSHTVHADYDHGATRRQVLTAVTDDPYTSVDVTVFGNLRRDFELLYSSAGKPVIKTFPQAKIGAAQTGYVFMVSMAGPNDNPEVDRYMLFPDGTGVIFQVFGEVNAAMRNLKKASSFAAFRRAFGADFASLQQNFRLQSPAK